MRALTFSLLLLASCGKVNYGDNVSVNEKRAFSQLNVESSELTRITELCSILETKAQFLGQALNETYKFDVSQKNCTDSDFSTPVEREVVIQRQGSTYTFRNKTDGLDFVFPDVETNVSGVVANICSKLSQLKTPLKLANGNAIWFTTSRMSGSDCNPGPRERCILVETGYPEGESYRVKTKEWIKFRIDTTLPQAGFYVERKIISSGLCGLNQSSGMKAILK